MTARRIVGAIFATMAVAALFWAGNTIGHDLRTGHTAGGWPHAFADASAGLRNPQLRISTAMPDLLAGAGVVALAGLVWLYRIIDQGTRRPGEEQGSARWGKPSDIKPFMNRRLERNLLLTQTERLNLERARRPEHQRNLNVLCIGASGTGKSRNFIQPNLANAQTSGLVTDPKGELLAARAAGLEEAGYQIRVLNLIDFAASHQFNPLAYLRPGHEPQDVALVVRNIISNTDGGKPSMSGADPFWERAETSLLQALIAFVVATHPPEDQHLGTVVDLLAQMQAGPDAEVSRIDHLFQAAREHLDENPDMPTAELLRYGLANFRVYQQAATKTAASIIVTTAVRLSPLHIPAVRRVIEGDTLQLDRVGFEPTMLFLVVSDVDKQFAWLSSLVFTMFFQRAFWLADQQPDRQLPVPVMCFMDEFANIGRIPDFEILAATLRSRGISFQAVVQNITQGQILYRDGWKTIVGNCDTMLFLGSADPETRDYISKALGRQTIQVTDTSQSKGRSGSYSRSRKAQGRELLTSDEVGRLPGDEAIVLIRGLPPFRSKKLGHIPAASATVTQPALRGSSEAPACRRTPSCAPDRVDRLIEAQDVDVRSGHVLVEEARQADLLPAPNDLYQLPFERLRVTQSIVRFARLVAPWTTP